MIQQDLSQLTKVLKKSFQDVRFELDDHLDAINQNTSEVSALYGFLRELEGKLDKLTERVDALSLEQDSSFDVSQVRLSRQEQEVFLVLFSVDVPLTPEQVARRLGLSKQLAAQYLYNLQLKGIPMVARNVNGELFYALELKFKDLQARNNILNIPLTVQEKIL